MQFIYTYIQDTQEPQIRSWPIIIVPHNVEARGACVKALELRILLVKGFHVVSGSDELKE